MGNTKSLDRTQMCDHSLESCLSSTFLWCCLFFNITQFVILENFSVLDLVLSGVKGLIKIRKLIVIDMLYVTKQKHKKNNALRGW